MMDSIPRLRKTVLANEKAAFNSQRNSSSLAIFSLIVAFIVTQIPANIYIRWILFGFSFFSIFSAAFITVRVLRYRQGTARVIAILDRMTTVDEAIDANRIRRDGVMKLVDELDSEFKAIAEDFDTLKDHQSFEKIGQVLQDLQERIVGHRDLTHKLQNEVEGLTQEMEDLIDKASEEIKKIGPHP